MASTNFLDATLNELPAGAVYIVGVAIFDKTTSQQGDSAKRLLVVQRAATEESFPNWWTLPGGKIEAGETVREAIFRETREEANLVVDEVVKEIEEMAWTEADDRPGISTQYRQLNFITTVNRPVRVQLEPQELSDWKWIEKKDIEALHCTMEMRKVLMSAFESDEESDT